MNKRGQMVLIGLMIAFFLAILTFSLITPIKTQIDTVRNSSNLDCANAAISTGTRLTCLVVDIYMPYFIGIVLLAAAGFVYLKGKSQTLPPQF